MKKYSFKEHKRQKIVKDVLLMKRLNNKNKSKRRRKA